MGFTHTQISIYTMKTTICTVDHIDIKLISLNMVGSMRQDTWIHIFNKHLAAEKIKRLFKMFI